MNSTFTQTEALWVAPQSRTIDWFRVSIWLLVGVLVAVTGYVRWQVLFLPKPDVGGVESSVVFSVLRMLAGLPLYENPEAAPFSITQYPPLYYYAVTGVARLAGIGPDEVMGVYTIGRLVSLLCNLGYVAALMALGQRALHLSAPVAVLAGALAFCLLPPQVYGRPDALMHALLFWALYAAVCWMQAYTSAARRRWAFLTALLLAQALFAKQSAVCLPVAVGVYFMVRRDWARLGALVGWLGFLLPLSYLVWIRESPAVLYQNVVQGIQNGIHLGNFHQNILNSYVRPYSILVVGVLAVAISYTFGRQPIRQLLGIAALSMFGFALLAGLKWGAAINYFTEFTGIGVLLLASACVSVSLPQAAQRMTARIALLLAIVVGVGLNAPNFNWKPIVGQTRIDKVLYAEDQQVAHYITHTLPLQPDQYIYSTQAYTSFLNAFLFRHCIVPQQDILLLHGEGHHQFDYGRLQQMAHTGQLRYIISMASETYSPLPYVSFAGYRPLKTIGRYCIWQHHRFVR